MVGYSLIFLSEILTLPKRLYNLITFVGIMKKEGAFLGLFFGVLGVFIMSASVAAQECVTPKNGMTVTAETLFCPGTYALSGGIVVKGGPLDCATAVLKGIGVGNGITVTVGDTIVKNCVVTNYTAGIVLDSADNVRLINNRFTSNKAGVLLRVSTNATLENPVFLDNGKDVDDTSPGTTSNYVIVVAGVPPEQRPAAPEEIVPPAPVVTPEAAPLPEEAPEEMVAVLPGISPWLIALLALIVVAAVVSFLVLQRRR